MGLEIIELIMHIEEEFDIHIPDEDAEKFKTVGDIENYVVMRLQAPTMEADAVYESLKSIIIHRWQLADSKVFREARLVEDIGLG